MNFIYQKDLHQALINKRIKAIGWGVPNDLLSKLKQAPYQFELLIEGTSNSNNCIGHSLGLQVWGAGKLSTLDPQEYVVVVLADFKRYGEQIVTQVHSIGAFNVLTPFCPWLQTAPDQSINRFVTAHSTNPQTSLKCAADSPIEKIAMVIYGFTRGGAEWQFFLLAKALRAQGKHITVYSMQRPIESTQPWLDELTDKGVSVVYLQDHVGETDKIDFAQTQDGLLTFLPVADSRLVLTMYYLMKPERFDCCISYLLTANILASLAAVLSNIPKILMSTRCSAPGTIVKDVSKASHLELNLASKATLLSSMIRFGNVKIAANSRFGAQTYGKWLGIEHNKMSVVLNGLVNRKSVCPKHVRAINGIPEDAFWVLGVMRFTQRKRPALFVECIELLHQRLPNIRATMIGNGILQQATLELIEQKGLSNVITLIGERQDVTDFMQGANVVLQTSLAEGLPNVILEAQQVGCPVVCSDAGGSEEALAIEVVHNCLVKSDTAEGYVAKLLGFTEQKNVEQFKLYAVSHTKRMTIENLAHNTLQAVNCQNIE